MHNKRVAAMCSASRVSTSNTFPMIRSMRIVPRFEPAILFMRTVRFIGLLLASAVGAASAAAQTASFKEKEVVEASSSYGSVFWMIFIVLLGLGGAYFLWSRSRKAIEEPTDENRYREYYRDIDLEVADVDGDQELEWLRQAKRSARATKKTAAKRPARPAKVSTETSKSGLTGDLNFDTRIFQEKMRMLQYAQLPINSFTQLSPSKTFEPLTLSNDGALLSAIEQANEEYEEDEAVRELAVRILAAFRTLNSVEALAQIALYDLSANLRSKAVSILTDFDHESVFETILLACADPTREVRAAAARGLFRLNFDRADAWKRIIETGDEFRMTHAARAACEAGIAQKSFERLVHDDMKIAYEAFALVSLLIKAGETKHLFEALGDHKDERVKFALLHVIKVTGDPRTLSGLSELRTNNHFSVDVVNRMNDVVSSVERVAA
jgi:hypothetical protein